MIKDWNAYRSDLLDRIGDFAKLNPDVLPGLQTMQKSTGTALEPKMHELIALAVAVTTRCDGCIAIHAKEAVELGASKEEIAEALGTAIALNAGAALTYSARVFDTIEALPK